MADTERRRSSVLDWPALTLDVEGGGPGGHLALMNDSRLAATGPTTITGGADHPHSITLTQAQRNTILAGTAVTVPSTTDAAHQHSVTVACA